MSKNSKKYLNNNKKNLKKEFPKNKSFNKPKIAPKIIRIHRRMLINLFNALNVKGLDTQLLNVQTDWKETKERL